MSIDVSSHFTYYYPLISSRSGSPKLVKPDKGNNNLVHSFLGVLPIRRISVYRHVQTLGMQVAYNIDTPQGIRHWVRRLMAIPLVPPIRVQGFSVLLLKSQTFCRLQQCTNTCLTHILTRTMPYSPSMHGTYLAPRIER